MIREGSQKTTSAGPSEHENQSFHSLTTYMIFKEWETEKVQTSIICSYVQEGFLQKQEHSMFK